MDNTLIITERDNDNIWRNLPEVERKRLLKYRGFDSLTTYEVTIDNQLKLEENLIHVSDFESILKVYEEKIMNINNQVDMIILEIINDLSLKYNYFDNFKFIGYDIGVVEEYNEYTLFSLILNELRINGNANFKEIINMLNEKYLFDNIQDCQRYLKLREKAIINNETVGIETSYANKDVNIVRIFLYKGDRI